MLVPLLSDIQEVVSNVRVELLNITNDIYWWDDALKSKFKTTIENDAQLADVNAQIDQAILGESFPHL